MADGNQKYAWQPLSPGGVALDIIPIGIYAGSVALLATGVGSSRAAPGPGRAMAKVERREALRPASLGAHAPVAASPGNRDQAVGVQPDRSQGPAKGALAKPLAPPAAPPPPRLAGAPR